VLSLGAVRPASIAFTALASSLTLTTGALPGPALRHAPTAHAQLGPSAMRFGRSLGSPTEGHLTGGMRLEESGYIRIVPADAAGDIRWGLEPLVTMVDRAARAVRRQFPEAVTSVGHLSREGGGEVERHRSHESGRDADIGFFVRSSSGHPLLASHFVAFRGDGTAPTWPGAYFDEAKNWALVSAILGDEQAHVTHIFVASPLRARLLAYAEKVGASMSMRLRAAEVMQQPHGALPHDDHFHVRIACPGHMSGCVENPALRASTPPMRRGAVAHGRRGPAAEGLASVQKRAAPTTPARALPPLPAAAPVPAAHEEAALPAASLVVPIDDLDE
jgi:penicillin-insensitive murein endopeptidase